MTGRARGPSEAPALPEASEASESAERVRRGLARQRAGASRPGRLRVPRDIPPYGGGSAPLSFPQQRLWFLQQLAPRSAAFNIHRAWRLRGPLDRRALRRALAGLLARHPVLSVRFEEFGGEPVQVTPEAAALRCAQLPEVDLSALPDPAAAAERVRQADSARPVPLGRPPLVRCLLVRLDAGSEHLLTLTVHHAVFDGGSLAVAVDDLGALYAAEVGRGPAPPAPAVGYADYAAWQRRTLIPEALEPHVAWWRERLAGAPELLELPADRRRTGEPSHRGGVVRRPLPEIVLAGLRRLERGGTTPFMAGLAAFAAFLGRVASTADLVVGTPVDGRTRRELDGVVGCFVDTLALRVDLAGDPTFAELAGRVRETTLGALQHQEAPLEVLVERLSPARRRSHSPLFQTVFSLQRGGEARLELPGVDAEPAPRRTAPAQFDLFLTLEERGGGAMDATLVYATDLFGAESAERLLAGYVTLLAGALSDPSRRLSELSLLTVAERQRVVVDWNRTGRPYPAAAGLAELFARQAAARPDAVALVHRDGGTTTYGELARRARRLAARLARRGVGPETGVGLALDRSPEMVEAMLAVLEAGGHYVPLDPSYPAARLASMVGDAGCRLVLATRATAAALPEGGPPRLLLDAPEDGDDETPGPPPGGALGGDALAYVMYTSGSTGQPKGVAVTQRNVARLVLGADYVRFGPDETFLQLAPASFDAATLEVWGPLLTGGRLALAPPGPLSLDELARTIERLGVTTLWLTAGLFHQVVDERIDALASVRQLLAGGDVLSPAAVARVLRELPDTAMVNGYGPTENTTFTCCHRAVPADGGGPVPIGRPIANTRVYMLDPWMRPVPTGVAGELYAGGDGVARGYVGRPASTAERFVPDPFSRTPGARLYRTGDLARWRGDGTVAFLGRRDAQVKIRGFRVEPGEVESALAALPGVAAAAVAVREDEPGERRLVAYAVPAEGAAPSPSALAAGLAERLPAHMVPSVFVVLDALPLDPNGKVDRRALPAPPETVGEPGGGPPLGPVEEGIARIWRELLPGSPEVGREDDFFALGGHSLLATRAVSRIRRDLGVEVPLAELFAAPTVAGLAGLLGGAAAEAGDDAAVPVGRDEPLPLSPAQERLWFLEQLEPGTATYLIPGVLRLAGPLDAGALAAAVGAVLARHEALRTAFVVRDGRPFQRVAPPPARPPLRRVDLAALPPARRARESDRLLAGEERRPFDLGAGLLLRTLLVRLAPEEHLVSWTLHHAASDGWSAGIFLRDLSELYAAACERRPARLPALPVQVPDVAVWQRRRLEGERIAREVEHWRRALAGAPAGLDLPTDRPRPAVQGFRAGSLRRELPAAVERRLGELAAGLGATPFMALCAALAALLGRHAATRDLCLGTPVSGRGRPEVEDLVGCFLNTLVLRVDLEGRPSFRRLVERVRRVATAAYAHQEVPFERLLDELDVPRDLSRTPLFQVFLNLVPPVAERARFPGLEAQRVDRPAPHSKFDLTLYAAPGEDGAPFRLHWVYDRDLFDRERIDQLAAQLEALLDRALAAPDRPLDELPLAPAGLADPRPDPRAPLSARWEGPVGAAFRRRAAEAPERTAAADPSGALSYGELANASGRLARRLAAAGVGRGDLVAVWAHRSAPLACAALGVLEAGAGFAMLDPGYPAARLLAILELARPRALVRLAAAGEPPAEVAARVTELGCRATIVVPSVGEMAAAGWTAPTPAGPPAVEIGPDDVAYAAFTSGSTGRPKGVLGRHGSLTHFTPWQVETFGFGAGDRFSMLSGLAHDPLHRDLFQPLQVGAAVVAPDPERTGEPGYLAAWLARERITVAHLTPAMGQVVAERTGGAPAAADLRWVFLVGEALTRRQVDRLAEVAPRATCVNYYGSTETQRAVGYHLCLPSARDAPIRGGARGAAEAEILPLGRGVPDVQLLVVAARAAEGGARLAAVGEVGEIWVRSPHVALGYLDDPEPTAERFAPSPFTGRADDRVYRTGDLGRYRPDGEVTFAGRADHQVQVRGFRVEPGEVEATLERHPAVRRAAVVPRTVEGGAAGSAESLVAYVVPAAGGTPSDRPADPAELRAFLAARLPDYMVPAAFVALDRLPLTANGKLDRRGLPAPAAADFGRAAAAGGPAPPRTPMEEQVVAVWRELLPEAGPIGVDDDFFALGGHSLLATRVLARLRAALGAEIPLRALFEGPTPAALAAVIETARGAGWARAGRPPAPVPRNGELPLSWSQERLWFLQRFDPASAAYNLPLVLALDGELEAPALARGLGALAARHEVLRTGFREVAGRPVLAIGEDGPALSQVDLSALPEGRAEGEAQALAARETARPFALDRPPLVRARLLRLAPGRHRLLFVLHHAVTDGGSTGILVRELAALYAAEALGRPAELPRLPVQHVDWAAWQREELAGALEGQLAEACAALAGTPVLELPTDRPRPAVRRGRGAARRVELPAEAVGRLEAVARGGGATLYMALLACFETLLARWSGQTDFAVGTPVAGRSRPEAVGLIGPFANTVALRADLAGGASFAELLARVRAAALAAFDRADLPFERLVAALSPERDTAHTPVFQALFALQTVPPPTAEAPGLAVRALGAEVRTARFDLALTLRPAEGDGLVGLLEYDRDLFDPATADRLAAALGEIVAAAGREPGTPVADLPLLPAAERRRVVVEWNDTARVLPSPAAVHLRVLECAAARAGEVAVEHAGRRLTYGELAAASARVAARLAAAGVRRGDAVALVLSRSERLPAALLGVLRLGAAYVPVDPDFPPERVAWILEDALRGVARPVLLTERALRGRLPDPGRPEVTPGGSLEPGEGSGVRVLELEELLTRGGEDRYGAAPAADVSPDELAYVIYTSGSTGRPKGVEVRHGGLASFLASMAERPGMAAGEALLAVTTLSFDIAGLELFLPLVAGGRVVVAGGEEATDGERLAALLESTGAAVLQATPATWKLLLATGWRGKPGLRALCGGEAMPPELADGLLPRVGSLWNLYGPTETTIWSTVEPVTRPAAGRPVPIGRPIAGTRVYVVDRRLRPVPPGVAGDLWIAGDGLARGYRGRPGLTADRFRPDPFAAEPGGRAYATGDLARWHGDGRLGFLGRSDHQVKVRGHRIELGEIEVVLAEHPAVADAAATVQGAGEEAALAAYAVAVPGREPEPAELRDWLRRRLPEYMVPADVVRLDALPLTPNGKVDRRALPAPDRRRDVGDAPYAAPRDAVEAAVAGAWAEVLGLDPVGSGDGFFALGGHSLLAVRAAARVGEALDVELPVAWVFEAPTPAALAERLRPRLASAGADGAIPRLPRGGPLPASYAQERIWFLERLEPSTGAFLVPGALRLSGLLDHGALAAAVRAVGRRHEVLRTRLAEVDGRPVQLVEPAERAGLRLRRIDLSGLDPALREAEVRRLAAANRRRPLDLGVAPLARLALLDLAPDEAVLAWAFHHAAADGWSVGVLLRDLATFYRAVTVPGAAPPRPLRVQLADHAAWQRGRLDGPAGAAEVAWWRERLAGAPESLELPSDRPRPATPDARGARLSRELPAAAGEALRRFAAAEGTTPFAVLLAAFGLLLSRLAGQREVLAGAPVAGRGRAETLDLVGPLLNTVVLRLDTGGGPSFRELVRRARAAAEGALAHAEVPFERLLEELRPERDLGRTPWFQAMLNHLPPAAAALDLPGIAAEPVPSETTYSKLDLTLYVGGERADDAPRLHWVYRRALFDRARIEETARQLETLLDRALASPDAPAAALPLLTAEAAASVGFGAPVPAGPWQGPVHELLARRAAEAPDRPAVRGAGVAWTYGELASEVDRAAARLAAAGVGRGDVVAVWAHRSPPLAAAVLGVLRAGAVFTVLDPAQPPLRNAAVVRAARPAAVVTWPAAGGIPGEVEEALAETGCVARVEIGEAPAAGGPSSGVESGAARAEAGRIAESGGGAPIGTGPRPWVEIGPEDAAYLAFTSGSTGEPRGVVGTHGALGRFVGPAAAELGAGPDDRFALLAGLAHDPLHRDLFTPLALGAELCVPDPERIAEPGGLAAWLAETEVTVAHLTPSLAQRLGERAAPAAEAPGLPALRTVVLYGEAVRPRDVARLAEAAPEARLVLSYGSTETARAVTYRTLAPGEAAPGTLPLGRGGPDCRLAVLRGDLAPCGIGELGEVWMSGANLALGYLAAPAATAERFRPDPFAGPGEAGGRMCRTGDLGRWRPDGEVAFAGRADRQVKVRGFRVEPAEVEAALLGLPEFAEAAVVAREDAARGTELVAYVVAAGPAGPAPLDPSRLAQRLRRTLPAYAVPAAVVPLDALPRTPNGKLDRAALPDPPAAPAPAEGELPRSPLEEMVAGVWRELLGRDRVDADGDFFALGGHSLLATRAVARLAAASGVDLPLRALFEDPTPARLAARIETALRAGDAAALPPIEPLSERDRRRPLPLSFSQERQWLLEQIEPGSPAYAIPLAVRIRGRVDAGALAAALARVVDRHGSLRTTFTGGGEGPRQLVAPPGGPPPALPRIDLADLPADRRAGEARRLRAAEAHRPFDLARGPLLRTRWVDLGGGDGRLLATFHHAVSDGWSSSVFVGELREAYRAAVERRPPRLASLPVQYADFAVWQRRRLAPRLDGQLAWWTERLAGVPALELPADRPRPSRARHRGGRVPLALDREETRTVHRLAGERGATTFMVLLAAWEALVGRLSGQDRFAVGTFIANRNRAETERLVGFFVNSLALPADLAGDPTFDELLARVRTTALDAYARQDLPFERLLEALAPVRDPALPPVFQTMLVLQNLPPSGGVETDDADGWQLLAKESDRATVDLAAWAWERDGVLRLELEYDADLFDRTTVETFARSFRRLLAAALGRTATRLRDLPLLDEDERRAVIVEPNRTAADLPGGDVPVDRLFAARAAADPGALAVVAGGRRVTYGELAAAAERLADRLRALGVRPDEPVAVLLDRSPEAIAALAGILSAGAAYLPIDPAYPAERTAWTVEDATVRLAVTSERLEQSLPAAVRAVVVDDLFGAERQRILAKAGPDVPQAVADDRLAYVLYTSGSTGRPKGVMVTHRALAGYTAAAGEGLGIGPGDRVLQFASLSFDASAEEIWPTLTRGAALVLRDDGMLASPSAFFAACARAGVTVLDLPTAWWHQLAAAVGAGLVPPQGLRAVIVGGEQASAERLADWRRGAPGVRLLNTYGPTETTVVAAAWEAPDDGPAPDRVPIGRPVANVRLHLLGPGLEPVPDGVAGELWIGGRGLARGYLGRPALTADRFRPDPFAAEAGEPGARLYRSGDRCRRRHGELEFLGRLDAQVKVRGFRVEPGEVEEALRRHPGVEGAAVAARDDGGGASRLIAWVVGGAAADSEALRGFLRRHLPEHMVPALFVPLDALPLTAAGKIDRRALRDPEPAAAGGDGFVAPATAAEELLAEIWAEVLGRERVGAADDFFALGGHSLLATQVVARVAREIGLELPVREVFETPVLNDLAAGLERRLLAEAGAGEGGENAVAPLEAVG